MTYEERVTLKGVKDKKKASRRGLGQQGADVGRGLEADLRTTFQGEARFWKYLCVAPRKDGVSALWASEAVWKCSVQEPVGWAPQKCRAVRVEWWGTRRRRAHR